MSGHPAQRAPGGAPCSAAAAPAWTPAARRRRCRGPATRRRAPRRGPRAWPATPPPPPARAAAAAPRRARLLACRGEPCSVLHDSHTAAASQPRSSCALSRVQRQAAAERAAPASACGGLRLPPPRIAMPGGADGEIVCHKGRALKTRTAAFLQNVNRRRLSTSASARPFHARPATTYIRPQRSFGAGRAAARLHHRRAERLRRARRRRAALLVRRRGRGSGLRRRRRARQAQQRLLAVLQVPLPGGRRRGSCSAGAGRGAGRRATAIS
jgi:hypothetical protein